MLSIKNKITWCMDKLSCSGVIEGYQYPIVSWPNGVIKSPSRKSWLTKVDELLLRQGVSCSFYITNTKKYFGFQQKFLTKFLEILCLTSSTFFYIKIIHIFNTILHLWKTQLFQPLSYLHVSIIFSSLCTCFPDYVNL